MDLRAIVLSFEGGIEDQPSFEQALVEEGATIIRSWRVEGDAYVVLGDDASDAIVQTAVERSAVRVIGAGSLVLTDVASPGASPTALPDSDTLLPPAIDRRIELPPIDGGVVAALGTPPVVCGRCFGVDEHLPGCSSA